MKQREKIEFRYYELPQGFPVIDLTGEKWEGIYGTDAMHFHNCLEIGICRCGEGEMSLGGELVPYRDGTITVIPKNQVHCTRTNPENAVQKWEYLFIDAECFLRDAYADRIPYAETLIKKLDSRMFLIQPEEQRDIAALLDIIFDDMGKMKGVYRDIVRGLLTVLLLKILSVNGQDKSKRNDSERNDANYRGIIKVLNYISQNYEKELKVGDIARICSMSETHFRRTFEEYMHTSPNRYINLVRVERACELIRKDNDKIENIGMKVGFPVHATFVRNFRSITGYSPMEWRAMLKKEGNLLIDFKVEVLKGWDHVFSASEANDQS